MRHYLFGGLAAIVAATGGSWVEAGGPGLLHCLAAHAHCRHHDCNCAKAPLVIHCCPPAGGGGERYRETARPETTPAPALIQASVPNFGYPGMAMMPMPMAMPMAFGMPQAYSPPSYPQSESARSQQDCGDRLQRLEDDVRQLSRDVDRVVDVVDRHSQVLDKLVKHLETRPDFQPLFNPSSPNGGSPQNGALPPPPPTPEPAAGDSVRATNFLRFQHN